MIAAVYLSFIFVAFVLDPTNVARETLGYGSPLDKS